MVITGREIELWRRLWYEFHLGGNKFGDCAIQPRQVRTEIFSTSDEVFGVQLTKSSDKRCRYTRLATMDTAPRLPNSTVAMLVESLTAYSVGNTPNRIGTLTVFGSGGQLVGAIDLGDQENPVDVSKNDAQQMIEVAGGLIRSAISFDNLMKYIKVSYKDQELLVIPGEQYNVAAVIDSTE